MSRFLTPSKLTVLALGLIYTEDLVPTSQASSVLAFLLTQIVSSVNSHVTSSGSPRSHFEPSVPISVFESALSSLPSARPGRTLYDLLLKRLWAINCSDALDAFITNLPQLLSKTREQILQERATGEVSEHHGGILRTSPLGAFIRRCNLEYMRLQFQDSISLWHDFIAYRAPTRQAFEKKNAADGRVPLDANFTDLEIDGSHPLAQIMYGRLAELDLDAQTAFSTYDVEKLMEFQVSEMQRLGGRLPDEMKVRLKQMSDAGLAVPKLSHYLAFLDAWRAGDYFSAVDNLHRYFDYTMQNRERTFYQYALLNLAILQADFGCHAEAIPAMQEAISTARETKDVTCLNFCMSWLYHFGRSFSTQMKAIRETGILGSDTEGLQFLKSRAKDSEMWTLLSTSLLSEAKLGLQYGDSIATVFENITKASHLNNVKATQGITGPTLLIKGATFSRIGVGHLGWLGGEIYLQCHAKDAPLDDVLKCTCRRATLLAQRGRWTQAEEALTKLPASVLRVLKFQNYLSFFASILNVRRLVHRHDLNAASRLIERLKGQGAPDPETGFSMSLVEVDLLCRRGILDQALQMVEKLAKGPALEFNDVAVYTRLMILKARILIESGLPLKAFSLSVRAAQLAHHSRLLPHLWESIDLVATILIELSEFTAAADLVQSIMPQVLECQDCELAAISYSVLVDANMGLAGQAQDKSTKQKEHINRALEHIDHAYVQFRYLEDLRGQQDMLKKKATILHWQGDLVLADDTATQFLDVQKQYAASAIGL